MGSLVEQSVAIVPPGALGVSFHYHLTQQLTRLDPKVFFLARPGSASSEELRKQGALSVEDEQGRHQVPLGALPDLKTCHDSGTLPEIMLVCPNPDQMLELITAYVEMLGWIHQDGDLLQPALPLPMMVMCSNGIYFQRIRQVLIEKLEEATMYGRLPDLWPDVMPRIVGRLLRGVTIQTGVREGSGRDAVYRPGPSGLTILAGGGNAARARCGEVLTAKGAWVELAGDASPTRVEFDKAMINLVCNLLGQLYAIGEDGRFRPLRVEQIATEAHLPEMRELAERVFRVGKAVNAYGERDRFEEVLHLLLSGCERHRTHIPSSLQWVALRLRLGKLESRLTPTEAWLLEPLIRYARSARLESDAAYFESLKRRLLDRLRLASHRSSLP